MKKRLSKLAGWRTSYKAGEEVGTFWPKSPLEARAIPEGILPLDREDGFDHDVKLEKFFNKYAPKELAAWGEGMLQNTWFASKYSEEFRRWIKTELIVSPTCLISLEKDIILIADEKNSFSVIGASKEIIAGLEEEFGGAEALKAEFVHHVDKGDLGFDDIDQNWAREYLLPWCGWA